MAAQALAQTARLSLTRRSSPAAAVLSLGEGRPSRLLCRSTTTGSSSSSDRQLEPPNLTQLCEKARLYLTPEEVSTTRPLSFSPLRFLTHSDLHLNMYALVLSLNGQVRAVFESSTDLNFRTLCAPKIADFTPKIASVVDW